LPIEGPIWAEISRFGKKVIDAGLASSRFGNISILKGDEIFITCSGSMLDELDEDGVAQVGLCSCLEGDGRASSETCVHRAVYSATNHRALIHTHSPYAVVESLLEDGEVVPLDGEGMIFLGSVPIVEGGFGSEDLAAAVSSALQNHKACIARGHGVFAAGKSLHDAYTAAAMAEHSAQVRYLVNAYSCGAGRRENVR
jgi:L-fuculose-phosphate aldolase